MLDQGTEALIIMSATGAQEQISFCPYSHVCTKKKKHTTGIFTLILASNTPENSKQYSDKPVKFVFFLVMTLSPYFSPKFIRNGWEVYAAFLDHHPLKNPWSSALEPKDGLFTPTNIQIGAVILDTHCGQTKIMVIV